MARMTVMVPNSVKEAFDHIELLISAGVLDEAAGRLYQTFTVCGWDDGFVRLDDRKLASSHDPAATDEAAAVMRLDHEHLVNVRVAPSGERVLELTALASPEYSGHSELGWWKSYRIEFSETR